MQKTTSKRHLHLPWRRDVLDTTRVGKQQDDGGRLGRQSDIERGLFALQTMKGEHQAYDRGWTQD